MDSLLQEPRRPQIIRYTAPLGQARTLDSSYAPGRASVVEFLANLRLPLATEGELSVRQRLDSRNPMVEVTYNLGAT